MFDRIITSYGENQITVEIIALLFGAFILGYLFKMLIDSCSFKNANKEKKLKGFAKYSKENLQIVEGIGPKIEDLLKQNGIKNWKSLSEASFDDLKSILSKGGERFAMHDPSSWADQATLAEEERWEELKKFQDLLIGGRSS